MDVFPPGWDEERRAHVRDELDGFYAHLYGLPRDELAYILDTFASASLSTGPIVRRKDEARWGEAWGEPFGFAQGRLCRTLSDEATGFEGI